MPGGRAIIARPLFLYHTPIYREKKQVWIQAFTKWKKWHCEGYISNLISNNMEISSAKKKKQLLKIQLVFLDKPGHGGWHEAGKWPS